MEPWTYKWSVGSLRRQRKHSLNHELPKWTVGHSNGVWTYKRNVGRLRRQRKRSLNLELPKWSVGRPNRTLDAQMERGTFAQATKTLLKRCIAATTFLSNTVWTCRFQHLKDQNVCHRTNFIAMAFGPNTVWIYEIKDPRISG